MFSSVFISGNSALFSVGNGTKDAFKEFAWVIRWHPVFNFNSTLLPCLSWTILCGPLQLGAILVFLCNKAFLAEQDQLTNDEIVRHLFLVLFSPSQFHCCDMPCHMQLVYQFIGCWLPIKHSSHVRGWQTCLTSFHSKSQEIGCCCFNQSMKRCVVIEHQQIKIIFPIQGWIVSEWI